MKINLLKRYLIIVATLAVVIFPIFAQDVIIEEVIEEPRVIERESKVSLYIGPGIGLPWGVYKTGMKIQIGVRPDINGWKLNNSLFNRLTPEILVGYANWNTKKTITGGGERNLQILSVAINGKYDLIRLLRSTQNGIEYSKISIFGYGGIQYNINSVDYPYSSRVFDNFSSYGVNLGLGIYYNLKTIKNNPLQLDLQLIQNIFLIENITDQYGNLLYPKKNYVHWENGMSIGIAYPL